MIHPLKNQDGGMDSCMKRLLRYMSIAIVMCYGTLAFPQGGVGEQVINRRDQASGAFLATPQGMYQHYCAHCHGEDGKGGGRLWTSELSPTPTDLTATGLDETALAKFIDEGSAASGRSNLCPPWGNTISRQNIKRLSMHILSLNGERVAAEPQAPLESPGDSAPWFWILLVIVEVLAIGLLFTRRTSRKVV